MKEYTQKELLEADRRTDRMIQERDEAFEREGVEAVCDFYGICEETVRKLYWDEVEAFIRLAKQGIRR